MHSNLDRALDKVLKHEGGFVNHPKDPGGATNLGVTLANFRRYVKPSGTVEDLKKLTKAQAKTVFERHYWDAVRGNQLPSGLDYAVFDFGVNSGPGTAVRKLQKLVNAKQDGLIGPETLGAIAVWDLHQLINAFSVERLSFLKRLKTWPTFGKGWERRVKEVRETALLWTAEPPVAPIPAPPPQEVPAPPVPVPAPPRGITFDGLLIGAVIGLALFVLWYFFLR